MAHSALSNKSFDFIIAGGGTAGLVLASRLTENPDFNVLVIEAGSDRRGDPMISTPGTFLQLYGNKKYDWDFKTEPQKSENGAVHCWPRGKGLGGSSMINFLMYSHCSKSDLNIWRDLGNPGWGWTDIIPYFQRIERMHLPSDPTRTALSTEYIQPSLRGTSGMIHTSWQSDAFSWAQETWPKQSKAMGYPTSTDPRTGTSLGLFNQLTCVDPKDGTRSYAATSYFVAAEGRKNLTVVTESVVKKILWDTSGSKPRAIGVEMETNSSTIQVQATKEVLLSAGTIQSPQLLELSGIGDPTLLQTHDIPLVVSNPSVGENLQEHPMVVLSWTTKPGHPTAEHLRDDPSLLAQAMDTYAKTGGGPMAAAVTTTGFLDLHSVTRPGTDWSALATPDTHLPQRQLDLLMTQLEDKKEAVYQVSAIPSGNTPSLRGIGNSAMFFHSVPGNYFSMSCGLMHAFSRGSVHIKSSNVHDYPEIDPRYLSHPMDVELLAHSLFHMKEVVKTPPLADFLKDASDGSGEKEFMPGLKPFSTLAEARELAKERQLTMYHPTGTCAMLPREEGGVVDTELRVYGTEGLRVVDASVFPMNVQGNIMSLVYAVAEKASDVIKETYAGERKANGVDGTSH
ncbi:GMC oxidoreductase [Zasmidium cellare ATCC 36951]|uniref:GMC oxidoreductase n=1 Tax=Zasmidium cellare ATCC 36951 TaxID=1080233 RepID=A0A6A6CDE6_ZASCE|nr:GMC oxidoreductase [Zasmidium cellare ATCC 36951]KAF2165237.1 GMC oxidoreductase [Zasmidium cellare ATCC 36951]